MKVCLVVPRFPFPENGGDVVLLNDIMHYFKDIGYEVILLSYVERGQFFPARKEFFNFIDKIYPIKRSKFSSILYSFLFFLKRKPIQCGYYYSEKMVKELCEISQSEHPDLYVCHLIRMIPVFKKAGISKNVIVQMSDVLSKTYRLSKKSKGSFLKKIIYKIEEKPTERFEQKAVRDYQKVVLVSENDKNYFGNNPHVFYHNNGIRQIIKSENYNRNKIVFVGNMRTLQNVDGCLYFVNDIFPLILVENQNAVLYIVGSSPNEKIVSLESEHIHVTGYVDSVEESIKDASVSVAPIRVAAGIQNKVLISMACNVPVVLSSLIAKGIPQLENGKNCFVEDSPDLFARHCISLMNNEVLRSGITENASKMIKENYFWNIHLKDYEKFQSFKETQK